MNTALVILAAGKGTRMQSDLPKVLHDVASAPLLVHAISSGEALSPEQIVVVTGHGGALVEKAAIAHTERAQTATQTDQLGTAHAVRAAEGVLTEFQGDVFILYGDTPFITAETLTRMQAARAEGSDVVVLGFEAADPGNYGRLIVENGALDRIVEAKEATPEELSVTLCNSGVMCADRETLFSLLAEVKNDNAKGEYYLTDIVEIARGRGLQAAAVACDETETLGCDSRVDLATAESIFQTKARRAALENGVTLHAPETVYFSFDTHIGRDVVIEPNVVFGPGVTVETGARIRAFSHLEGCHVGEDAIVGPYARLRPGTELGGETKVGNFVEIKNATIERGAKVNHLTYIGDAEIGERANIGAGTITCNYDGVNKHKTIIGKDAFIGSNSSLVAPIGIAEGGYVASGSVVTKDVGEGDLAIARVEQVNKKGLGARMVAKLRAAKAKKKDA
jgi:bifunctional UDP-N-acetylglucosamine pyrophosphorylase/glucosamine-1-phosphate N-acetyltransferase